LKTEQREYLQTHPWLNFRLDLRRMDHEFWMLIGEARSKIQHIAGSLLKPEVGEQLHGLFLAKGVLATTAIEGNTLTEEDARRAVEGTLRLPPSQEYLQRELENILHAWNTIEQSLLSGRARPIDSGMLRDWNRRILDRLSLDDGVVPGEIRTHSVMVGARYRGAPAQDCGYLLDRLCEWLASEAFEPPTAEMRTPYAIIRAVAAHLYLAWIHPFGDGNGRTARLVELQILLSEGVPTPAVHLLSNHYNQTRAQYYRELEAASLSGGDIGPFLKYALRGLVDGLRDQLKMIREQQWDARWEQYIYERFGDAKTQTQLRQRQLTLELSKEAQPVKRSDIRRASPAIAELYAGKTDKTISRDLNALLKMDLLELVPRVGYRPRRERVLAFLPLRMPDSELDI
jgi:Fic family protein